MSFKMLLILLFITFFRAQGEKSESMKKTVYYVTSNPEKYEEVRRFVMSHEVSFFLDRYNYDLDEPQIYDQKAIAVAKAKQAWNILKKPVLVDDSGIYFEQYNRFPGTLSKFVYQGLGFEGIFKLVKPGDRAYFLLYLVYCDGPDSYQVFEGRCPGTIIEPETKKKSTLPYLAMVIPDGAAKSFLQLRETGEDERYNFRIEAFKKFLDWYTEKNIITVSGQMHTEI